jgi:hypothetical protein
MGFLQDLSLDQIDGSEIDWTVPNGVYPAMITESGVQDFNGKTKWLIKYKIDPDEPTSGGKIVSEFFDLDPALPDNRKAFLKRRLMSLEITDDQAASMDPGDVIGVEVVITVKNRPAADGSRMFTNVTKVTLANSAGSGGNPNYLSGF